MILTRKANYEEKKEAVAQAKAEGRAEGRAETQAEADTAIRAWYEEPHEQMKDLPAPPFSGGSSNGADPY